jgi:hypothetical protein
MHSRLAQAVRIALLTYPVPGYSTVYHGKNPNYMFLKVGYRPDIVDAKPKCKKETLYHTRITRYYNLSGEKHR